MSVSPAALLRGWLNGRVEPPALDWLDGRLAVVRGGDVRQFYLTFGLVPRRTGKTDLDLSKVEQLKAEDARPGWDLTGWSVDHAARTLLVLAFPSPDCTKYLETLDKLFTAGEVSELIALYQALPLLPHQEAHVMRAAEGLRTNIKPVFTAIAHRNPYPAEQFDEVQWNQMILKCLFIGVPLAPVVGLDERINPQLMRMLCDYAHERWAAGRTVSPELWRCVGPVADERAIDDLGRALHEGPTAERQAAALALASSDRPKAKAVLDAVPELARDVKAGRVSWETITQTTETSP
ncbi:MAG: EboA domain-containing protein [Planctomycetaceae bacterium]|nr:EboA domain-containing protein [Planctomycetaceae bacterium]